MRLLGVNSVTGLFFVALGAFWIYYGRDYPLLKATGTPSVGMFPFIVASIMILLGLALFLSTIKKDKPLSEFRFHKGVISVIGIYLFTAFIWEKVGTIIALSLMLILIWVFYEKFSWKMSIPLALGATILLYSIFRLTLNVPLPQGWIGF